MTSGWWELSIKIWDDNTDFIEPDDNTREHIAEMIKQGYTSGDVCQEEEVEE